MCSTAVIFVCASASNSPMIAKRQTDDNAVEGTGAPYIEILRGRYGRDGHDGEPGP